MKTLDHVLQRWRIAKAQPYIPSGARVLDIGCGDGALFRQLKSYIGQGVGIDPDLDRTVDMKYYTLISGQFPQDLPESPLFDVITMLAVLEHIPLEQQSRLAMECMHLLKPQGHLVITVPSPMVDPILDLLRFVRLIDGQALEEHYGFDPHQTPSIFSVESMVLHKAKKFQLGLNNLFVFKKIKS